MRVLVLGGFEPSGHDRAQDAIVAGGRTRGHDIVAWHWEELADHPVFHAHRRHAEGGGLPFPRNLFGPTFGAAIAVDICRQLPDLAGFDHVVSCHPYSTLAACAAAGGQGAHVPISDVHTDFTSGPALWSDCLTYSFAPRHDESRKGTRLISCGIPIEGFGAPDNRPDTERLLVVLSGHGGWLSDHILANLRPVVDALDPHRIVVAGASQAPETDIPVTVVSHVDDMSSLLRRATWALTKCSGGSVAECLDTGTRLVGVPSGVPWEDDALRWLAFNGLATTPDVLSRVGSAAAWDPVSVASWVGHGERSLATVWDTLSRHRPTEVTEEAWLEDLLRTIERDPRLPSLRKAASRALRSEGTS